MPKYFIQKERRKNTKRKNLGVDGKILEVQGALQSRLSEIMLTFQERQKYFFEPNHEQKSYNKKL
jgi:hypothetical protein